MSIFAVFHQNKQQLRKFNLCSSRWKPMAQSFSMAPGWSRYQNIRMMISTRRSRKYFSALFAFGNTVLLIIINYRSSTASWSIKMRAIEIRETVINWIPCKLLLKSPFHGQVLKFSLRFQSGWNALVQLGEMPFKMIMWKQSTAKGKEVKR